MPKREYVWPITIQASSMGIKRRMIYINATCEGAGLDPKTVAEDYISRKKHAWEWYGVEINVHTPLHNLSFIYEPRDY